jgi:hypothetical protein
MAQMGRPSVFAPKDPKCRFQGITTKEDARLMEAKRKELAKLSGVKNPSDGDLFGYMARGKEATIAYLAKKNGK